MKYQPTFIPILMKDSRLSQIQILFDFLFNGSKIGIYTAMPFSYFILYFIYIYIYIYIYIIIIYLLKKLYLYF